MKLFVGDFCKSSWSMRPWVALTAAGLDFETHCIRLDRPETKDAIAAVSPNGRVPVLHHDDLVISESLAICEWAAEQAPAALLWPADPTARAVARALACEMHAGFAALRREHPMDLCAHRPKAPSPEAAADLARICELWLHARRRFGTGGPFLFGGFTIADAMFAPVVSRIRTYALPTDANADAYAASVWIHPAVRAWRRLAEAEAESTGTPP